MSKSKIVEDANLSNQEWVDIYESRQTKKILTDQIRSVEAHDDKQCAIVFRGSVKILIPLSEMGLKTDDEALGIKVMYGMAGAEIDYIIAGINREDEICIGSRKKAMEIRQKELKKIKEGQKVKGRIVAVGRTTAIAEVCGIETKLRAADINWGYMEDIRNYLSVGDSVEMLVKAINHEEKALKLSIKEAMPDPYINIDKRYKIDSKYVAVITGIEEYGVFVNLEPGVDALCPHPGYTNLRLSTGDQVFIKLKQLNPEKRQARALIERLIRKGSN